jgi:hypothetical protein
VKKGDIQFTNGKSLSDYMGPGAEYEVPENYIRESILNPGKLVRENYTNVMPNNFASQLKPRQVEALVLMLKNLDSLVDDEGNIIEKSKADSTASTNSASTGEGG